jgi:hypothetical protein
MADHPRTETSSSQCQIPTISNRIRRNPSITESHIQSKYLVETQTDPPNPDNPERPNPTMKAKRYNLIPQFLVVCVIMAYAPTAHALSFTLNTAEGTGTGTLTIVDTGTVDSSDGYTESAISAITGTFNADAITGVDTDYGTPDNLIEIDPSGNILVDGSGISFDTANTEVINIYHDSGDFGSATSIDDTGTYALVTSFTGSAPNTPVPFQAPLGDAIPVIGSVLVLGALRKVRNFKKA